MAPGFGGAGKHSELPAAVKNADSAAGDPAVAESPQTNKRKAAGPPNSKGRFKIVAQMVIAMRRFQEALNPTYTYGKQHSTSLNSQEKVHDGEPAVNSRAFTKSSSLERKGGAGGAHGGKDGKEVHYAYADRGHKTDFLFKPLPAVPGERLDEDQKLD